MSTSDYIRGNTPSELPMAALAASNPRSTPTAAVSATLKGLSAAALGLGLVACGGGGGGGSDTVVASPAAPAAADCSLAGQKDWMRSFMAERYYWSGQSPNPEPGPFGSVSAYFAALQFTGNSTAPADRWSYLSDTASYQQFFAEGRTLGYGVFVNGNELTLPLKVRFTEARSPAALAGVMRGDTILSVNGVAAATLVSRADFSLLSPAREGDQVSLELQAESGQVRTVQLTATTFDLTPVPVATTLNTASGGKVGYLVLKDFITQAEAPLAEGLARLRNEGVSELILDLRYNGGGRVSTSNVLASLIAGVSRSGQLFTELRYNSRLSAQNAVYRLEATQPGFNRVVVLTGPRTCSASELVVNGLKPLMPVVTVGGATCGKPFGFNPTDQCGVTYSAVNFESFNAAGEGRYYNGIAAQCPATDDFSGTLGTATEGLTAAALRFLGTGSCPVAAQAPAGLAASKRSLGSAPVRQVLEPGERLPGMWVD